MGNLVTGSPKFQGSDALLFDGLVQGLELKGQGSLTARFRGVVAGYVSQC